MRELFTVAKFTMKDMLSRKSYIISTIIILAIIVLAFNIPNIKKMIGGSGEETGTKVLIYDSDKIYGDSLNILKENKEYYNFIIADDTFSMENAKEKIENDEVSSIIVFEKQNDKIGMKYVVKNLTMVKTVPEELVNIFTNLYSNKKIQELGLTQEQISSLNPNFDYQLMQTETEEVKGNPIVIMLISIVLFYAIYFCAYQVSTSITTEKTSKIIETLVTSTKPKTIVLGKTIGIGIVGLVQIVLIIATALISKSLFLEPGALDGIIDFSCFTPMLGLITFIYFILGYAFFALLYALTGSTVSKPEDVQSANSPVAIIAVIGFYLSYFTMMNPTSDLNKVAGILPISSPFCMPFRVMMGIASTSDIIISIAVLVVTIAIIALFSIRIYSQAILNYGSKISLKDAIKMGKNKDI